MTTVPAPPRPHFAAPPLVCERVAVAGGDRPARVGAVLPIRPDTPYLEGHFPGLTIFPGVFVLEAVRQVLWHALGAPAGAAPELRHLRSARLLLPLYPGDCLVIDADLSWPGPSDVDVVARCRHADGRRVASVHARLGWP